MADPEVVVRLLAAIDERERRYAERARDWREGMSDDELHQHRSHPAYQYRTTEGQRKAWYDADTPPEGDGWELNITSRDSDAFERFDYHEERYWRRLNPDGPDVWEPPAEVAEALRLCQSHRDIVALHKITVTSSESFDPMAERRVTDHDVECEVCGWCSDDPKEACATLTALARGYGIEDGETK